MLINKRILDGVAIGFEDPLALNELSFSRSDVIVVGCGDAELKGDMAGFRWEIPFIDGVLPELALGKVFGRSSDFGGIVVEVDGNVFRATIAEVGGNLLASDVGLRGLRLVVMGGMGWR